MLHFTVTAAFNVPDWEWGLVRLVMEEAALPVFTQGATFRNPDFAMFAQSCGAQGFRVTQPRCCATLLPRH
jgi:thiamine pyrophosphate-dependent acetolactate synthase large subunit-like protein